MDELATHCNIASSCNCNVANDIAKSLQLQRCMFVAKLCVHTAVLKLKWW